MKVRFLYVYATMIMFCNLFVAASEDRPASTVDLSEERDEMPSPKNVRQFKHVRVHSRTYSTGTLSRRGGRRSSLPTSMPMVPVTIFVDRPFNGRNNSISISLVEVQEEPLGVDLNKAVTFICANMNTSTSNTLGRALTDGVRMQFTREVDKSNYLHSVEALSKTKEGQNQMMRQFLESYQCKCEKLVQKADQISHEERIARDRALQATRLEANQKVAAAITSRTKWKRIAVGSLGAAGSFALMAIMQVLAG